MTDEELESLKRHVAGQTVLHISPFVNLPSYKNDEPISIDFINKWVKPYYMQLHNPDSKLVEALKKIEVEITDEVILTMLGDFNWRTRQTGAYFSAIKNRKNFIDIIGVHLLKSELTFACKIYLIVFASFNTPRCINYIETYLNYYLNKPDLFFDQLEAMQALKYLDEVNETTLLGKYLDRWAKFLDNKPYWKRDIDIGYFEKHVQIIETLKKDAS
jgi:Family of unknown function (DUF6000)